MKKPLVNFITEQTGKFLIALPPIFTSSNLIAFLLSIPEMNGKDILIITNDNFKIDSLIPSPLPSDTYVKYDDIKDKTLRGELYILFDNLFLYEQHKLNLLLQDPSFKIVGIADGKVKVNNNEWVILYLNIYDEGPIVDYKIQLINKTEFKLINIIYLALSKIHNFHLVYVDDIPKDEIIPENLFIINDKNLIIKDIEYLHFLNIPTLESFWETFNNIYQRNLFSQRVSVLHVIFYIDSDHHNDEYLYNIIYDSINEYQSNLNKIFSTALPIKFNSTIGLYVDITS